MNRHLPATSNQGVNFLSRVLFVLIVLTIGALIAPYWQPAEGPAADAPVVSPVPAPRGDLYDLERATIDIFEKYSPSVVSVINRALLRDYFSLAIYENTQGSGSGFVWDEKGHIISNYHVVHKASAVQVIMKDGTVHDADIVGLDPDHDIAVLRIDAPAEKLTPLPIGTSGDLKVGQRVLAIGNPFGFNSSLSVGVVSSLDREMRSPTGLTIRDIIQTDAAINQGNSGGPLLDSAGRVIGINTFIVSPTGGSIGLGFSIPIDTITRIVPQLIQHGKAQRVGLGVILERDRYAQYYGVQGALIYEVVRGSAAEQAGLRGRRPYQWGDVIVEIDGIPVRRSSDLRNILDSRVDGDEVEVKFVRNNKKLETKLKLQIIN
jgi:S1-C subfamily serine protease